MDKLTELMVLMERIFIERKPIVIQKKTTIEAEPVRHGKWIRDPTDKNYFICSVCGGSDGPWYEFADCTHKYCPWCGAKMDLEE